MRGPQVAAFADTHGLKRISVADLIAYRQAREKLVTRVAEFTIETESGEFAGYAYVTPFDKVHHYAFVYGKIGEGRDVPTRLHRGNVVEDVFGGAKTIHAALSRFKEAGRGVLVYLRDGTSGVPTNAIAEASAVAEELTASERERNREWREVGLGAQILRDLRISSIRLYATRERSYVGLAGFGIEIEFDRDARRSLEPPSDLAQAARRARRRIADPARPSPPGLPDEPFRPGAAPGFRHDPRSGPAHGSGQLGHAARQEQQRVAQAALVAVAPPPPEFLHLGRGRPVRIDLQMLGTAILGPLQGQRRQQIGGGSDPGGQRRADIEQLVQGCQDRGVTERVALSPSGPGGGRMTLPGAT